MFHFPAFPPHTLYIQARVTGHISSRVTPFGHPRIKARLPAPRGLSQAPTSFIGSWYQGIHRMLLQTYPYHSDHEDHRVTKMLASTMQFSSCQRDPSRHRRLPRTRSERFERRMVPEADSTADPEVLTMTATPSGPNSVPKDHPRARRLRSHPEPGVLARTPPRRWPPIDVPPMSNHPTTATRTVPSSSCEQWRLDTHSEGERLVLLRKEVIQPHLPVRLPCYDFVLIASPTFDGSLHKGWATGFGCYRLS
jgi:hypothetical protein